jgi:hypothetical protein
MSYTQKNELGQRRERKYPRLENKREQKRKLLIMFLKMLSWLRMF